MIELQEEWTAPWEVAAAVYIYKMENCADGDIERVGLRLGSAAKHTTSSSSSSESSWPDDIVDDSSVSSSDDRKDSLGLDTMLVAENAVVEAGDTVRLSRAGETSHARALIKTRRNGHSSPQCLTPGYLGEVLQVGQLPLASTITRYRVRVLAGSAQGGIYWYPREALALVMPDSPGDERPRIPDAVNTGAVSSAEAQRSFARGNMSGRVGRLAFGSSRAAWEPAEWEYSIHFQIPWVLRKVLGASVLQLATSVQLDTEKRVLTTMMRTVSDVMGIVVAEETIFRANPRTKGSTWERTLKVSYPDWLPKFAESKVKGFYNQETANATKSFRESFADIRARAPVMLASIGTKSSKGSMEPGTGVFLEQLGLAAGGLRSVAMVSQASRQVV